jgi:hypothetical protein
VTQGFGLLFAEALSAHSLVAVTRTDARSAVFQPARTKRAKVEEPFQWQN